MLFYIKFFDAPPNSSKNSNMNLKMKTMKKKGVGVRSLVRNILGVRKVHWSSKMETKVNDKWVNYSYGSTQIKQQVG